MISTSFKVLQVNLNRSAVATESALQLAVELNMDLIIVQEPWVIPGPDYINIRSVIHQSFLQILPKDPRYRPRTLVYVSRSFRPLVCLAASSPLDPDMLVIDIIEQNAKIQLLNIYNESDQGGTSQNTLDRCLYTYSLEPTSVVLGDFNTHHPWWDPLANKSQNADKLVNWLEIANLTLANTPGTRTFFWPNLPQESVLDLTFATSSLASSIQDWQTLLDLGSDHYRVLFIVLGTLAKLADNLLHLEHFNTQLANWGLFIVLLQSSVTNSSIFNSPELSTLLLDTNFLDTAATELTRVITNAAKLSIPYTKLGAKPKPWWSLELKALRTEIMRQQRGINSTSPDSRLLYLKARNTYFLAVKSAKQDHQNEFLTKEDPKSIFKAMAYTKDRRVKRIPPIASLNSLESSFEGKCNSFRSTLFPPPPSAPAPDWTNYRPLDGWKWPRLSRTELQNACSAKVKGKTPGPDQITQEIVTHAYFAIPDVFYKLYASLIDLGHHPKCWKQATGAILKKPGKTDYLAPKLYQVIALLNCLGKVSERILAQRLAHLAETINLLYPTQIGGRLKKSAIDAALLLTSEVESNQRLKRKTTTLLLDVKGAFDHVAKNQLLAILQRLRLPGNLILWISSFLDDRQLRLSFDGQIEEFSLINTGIPQGSPVSPILFLIYIRELFQSSSVRYLSYMDDISITVSLTSFKKNIITLEQEVTKLYKLSAKNAI